MNVDSIVLHRCPKCNTKIVVQRPSGETIIFQRAIVVRNGRVMAVCPDCKSENQIESMSYRPENLIVSDSQKKDLTHSSDPVTISQSDVETVSP